MEVACTLNCPKANQEVIITNPDGEETQKCEKCEGDCPKGGDPCVFVGTFAFGHSTLFTYTKWPLYLVLLYICTIIKICNQIIMLQQLNA